MTTTMQHAFANAKTVTPTPTPVRGSMRERLWNYIKDHPGVTASDLHSVFKAYITPLGVNQTMLILFKRGAVVRSSKKMYFPGPAGTPQARNIHTYSTPHGMKQYELPPEPAKTPKARPTATTVQAARVVDEVDETALDSLIGLPPAKQLMTAPPVAPVRASVDEFLDSLTIAEARALYVKLQRMFG